MSSSRFSSADPGPAHPQRSASPPFCHVERKDPATGASRHFVVHTHSPKFVVEFDEAPISDADAATSRSRPVIRRVCVANSWAGDYHQCARQLAAATAFFETARAHRP